MSIRGDGSRIKQDVRSYQFYANGELYTLGTEMSSGTYEVVLKARKKPSRTVDWIIKTQGETLNKWATWGGEFIGSEYQLVINADSISEVGLEINDVVVTPLGANIYKINTTNPNDEISRALIMKTLFYGTNGADPRAVSTYINAISVYSNDIRDNGKRGHYASFFHPTTFEFSDYLGTFSDTTTNTDCSSWSYLDNTGGLQVEISYEMPDGTVLNSIPQSTDTTIDETGTDRSADEKDNPADTQIRGHSRSGESVTGRVIYVCSGGISWVTTGAATTSNTDFLINESFPIFSYSNASVVLNSPADDYISSASEVEFNCSAEVPFGVTLTNISLWTNETGDWGSRNITTGLSGTTSTQVWSRVFSDGDFIDWTCQAGDSDGDSGFAIENRTFSIDTSAPSINITYPTILFDYGYTGQNISLNWTVSDTNLEQCWYEYNQTNSTVPCAAQNASFILTNQKNITFYANDSVANEGNFTRSWTNKLFGNSETYNLTTYETSAEGFSINITSDGTQLVLANLIYDGTSYTGTKVGNNSDMEFNRDLLIPEITSPTATSKSFYWNVTYGSEVIPTNTNNQSVGRIALGLCNATLTIPYINFTFKDEETTISTNASIDTSTWTYNLGSGDGTVNKTLLYSTTDANESYGFCFIPSDRTIDAVLELQYSDTGYPQRRWSTSGSLTNTTTEPTLYMLASADGTYSVYQVQDTVGNGIQGVEVQAERQFVGVWTLVEQGTTDSSGGFTGWLNPDYDHRITFTKSGYTTVQVTVRPSSSIYTVVMGTGQSAAAYNSSEEGLSWTVHPSLGKVLFPNTTQAFLFNITANLTNIVTCKLEVVNNNSVSLGTTIGCNSEGGNLSLSLPLGTNKSVRAIYSVDVGDGYFILDADAYWIVMTTNIPERGTLTAFFKHARDLNEFGSDNNRQEFSRIVFFFLILAIAMASLSITTGWDLITSGGSLIFMNFIIVFGSYAGFLTLSYTGVNGWMDQYVVALITSLFTVGFIFNKLGREA